MNTSESLGVKGNPSTSDSETWPTVLLLLLNLNLPAPTWGVIGGVSRMDVDIVFQCKTSTCDDECWSNIEYFSDSPFLVRYTPLSFKSI